MRRAARWFFLFGMLGCNAVLGIEQRDYREGTPDAGAAGAAGAVGAAGAAGAAPVGAGGGDASAGAAPDDIFTSFWSFERMDEGRVLSDTEPSVPLTVQQAELVAGPTGNHLRLGGAGSAVASSPVVDASGSFSISVWVRFDRLDTWNTVVSQDGETISSFFLQKRDSGALGFSTYGADREDAQPCTTTAIQPNPGQWYHVVATRDGASGEQRLYVDGLLSGRSTCAGGFRSAGPLVVGRGKWRTPTDWTSGAVDELGVTERVLSAADVVELYRRGRPDARHYLYAYFAEGEAARGDGLHWAHSLDGLVWNPVREGQTFLTPTVGGRSFRDPHVMRDSKGVYHVVWTSSCLPWAQADCVQDRGFGHATSRDLVTFSAQDFIEFPVEQLNAEHYWAPETFYDVASQQYLLTWSSPVDVSPNPDPHGIYYSLTKDFQAFSTPAVLYAGEGRDAIDATLLARANDFVMFFKDESPTQKNLRVVTSPRLFGEGAWSGEPSAPLTGAEPVEGPSPLVRDGELLLLYDRYTTEGLGALRARDVDQVTDVGTWEDVSSSARSTGLRHGAALEVPFEVFRAVALRAAQ